MACLYINIQHKYIFITLKYLINKFFVCTMNLNSFSLFYWVGIKFKVNSL